jgi:CDP-glucose 4,6-dehydratase
MLGETLRGKRVLVTGHTGFKGSWLSLWLQSCGAEVHGIALPPEAQPNHWQLLRLDMPSYEQDIRDGEALSRLVQDINPEVVFHLAAQAYVRRSYRDPMATWDINVLGTGHLLQACRTLADLKALVVVTTDKCYKNNEWQRGYREDDTLGGHDPYSASKAATELLVSSFRDSFFQEAGSPLLATARAGNVVGGGDWSEDRLIPDAMRAVAQGEALVIRAPNATRPWQHVLEALAGYVMLAERLLAGDRACARAWNFGPDREGNRPVKEVLQALASGFPELCWKTQASDLHETGLLYLDSTAAREQLHWRSRWSFDATMAATAEWYRAKLGDGEVISRTQLEAYLHCVV